jgi:hypothetical protein
MLYREIYFHYSQIHTKYINIFCGRGRDRVVDIASRYKTDGPGFKPQWEQQICFFIPFQTGPRAHPAFPKMGTGAIFRFKVAGTWRSPPTFIQRRGYEYVEVYAYSLLRASNNMLPGDLYIYHYIFWAERKMYEC